MIQWTIGCEWSGHGDGEKSVKEAFQIAGFGSEEGYLLKEERGDCPEVRPGGALEEVETRGVGGTVHGLSTAQQMPVVVILGSYLVY